MNIETLLQKINTAPQTVSFDEVIAAIDECYRFTPTAFKNGEAHNEAGQNNGSCKIFAFASLHNLNEQQTLHCFGDYYRVDVLQNPQGDSHQNIRQFMQHGWSGISMPEGVLEEVGSPSL